LYVTVTTAPILTGSDHSFATVDGWTISYDKFLIALGNASFDGDSCADYYDADYTRIVNPFVAGPQKLGLLYGLGQCDFGYRLSGPGTDAVLGQDVTDADRAFMGTPRSDLYATNRGIDLYVQGRATNGAATKTFAWEFRQRLSFFRCSGPAPGTASAADAGHAGDGGDAGVAVGGVSGFHLSSGQAETTDLRVHGETLFLDNPDPDRGFLTFADIASADDRYGNADGDVTLSELGSVPLSDLGLSNVHVESGDAGTVALSTLEDLVYLGLVPHVVRFEDRGTCEMRTRR
jgi:hypothetical protein